MFYYSFKTNVQKKFALSGSYKILSFKISITILKVFLSKLYLKACVTNVMLRNVTLCKVIRYYSG